MYISDLDAHIGIIRYCMYLTLWKTSVEYKKNPVSHYFGRVARIKSMKMKLV